MMRKALWFRTSILFGVYSLVLTSISIYFDLDARRVDILYDTLDLLTWVPSFMMWAFLEAYYFPDAGIFFLDDTLPSTLPLFATTMGVIFVIATTVLAYALIGAWIGWLIESVQFFKKRARTVRD